MKFHFRKNLHPGPFRFTLTEKGLSWGLKVGRWSWNPRTRKHTINTPGLGSVQLGGRDAGGSAGRSGGGGGPLGILLVVVVLGGLALVVLSGWPL